jgi:RimJ/RimL family protein N-acetyltransferase
MAKMISANNTVFETKRLRIRPVEMADADHLYSMWNEPRVMKFVGFPYGLKITREEVCKKIEEQVGRSEFDHLLIPVIKATGEAIGECKMYLPEADGIAHTDVKLHPDFWGHKYGVEVKTGLLAYLFQHTDCNTVSATPNVENIASIKMQEAVGGIRIAEETCDFPPEKRHFTKSFHYYVYHATRENWEKTITAHE